jgi:tetratricopeptide (TPR) repeat protein
MRVGKREKSMKRLIIRQEADAERFRFVVDQVRVGGVRSAPPVDVANPLTRPIEATEFQFGDELAWYLERYLDYPFGFEPRAERVLAALRAWGTEAFEALFGEGQARDFYRDATRDGHEQLHLAIVAAKADVLAWPWEALHDPVLGGDLAHHCRIERQLDRIADPPPLHPDLSRDRIGILLVSPRPYDRDIAYRSVSRPLVTMIEQRRLPVDLKLLRPPTLAALRAELATRPGAYHIVHFDGHGGFGSTGDGGNRYGTAQGTLAFEDSEGRPDPVTAAQLSQLLREHRIPIAVLNACQSAMLGKGNDDAFASVATALLRAGVRSVVAMGYSLYVSAAQQFLPDFYERLFATGEVAEAVRWGRKALLAQPKRSYDYALEDWMVPVLYQQEPLDLAFAATAHHDQASDTDANIPEEARLTPVNAPHGLIGRDSAILALERASRRPPAGLIVHGLGGIGKTTLARGYIEWLAQTQGLPAAVIWFSFEDIRSADYVLNRLVEALFGANAMAAPDESKWPALRDALRATSALIVWDNFESASGAADAGGGGAMPEADRLRLKQWLEELRGGATHVLITSRSDESWLGRTACYRVPLGGLQGEEREALTRAILADLGIAFDPKDQAVADLVDDLDGHALMMRAVLPRLATESAESLRRALETYVPDADSDDPAERRLYATLRFVEEGLDARVRPLLVPLGFFIGHVDSKWLAGMAKMAEQSFTESDTRELLEQLEAAGLVQGLFGSCYRLHPALTRYLRARVERFASADELTGWKKAFTVIVAVLADDLAPRPLHEQRPFFALFGSCIEAARAYAEMERDFSIYGALTQALASFAQHRRDFSSAERYFKDLAALCESCGKERFAAAAYHQLGRVAEERRNFDAAEAWYLKSLKIEEGLGNEPGLAISYHQLGTVAQMRRDYEAAERWYLKSLEIEDRLGNEDGAASAYHQLGIVAQERGDFNAAESWYLKALEIRTRLDDEFNASGTYHQLGVVMLLRDDLDDSEKWYSKALEIKERLGDEDGAASTYHQLGRVAQERRDYDAAERWFLKSLQTKERLGNEHGAALTYHQLGIIAHERGDLDTAERWYLKSLEIKERLDNEHGATATCHQLSMVALERSDFDAAERWCGKSLEIEQRIGNEPGAAVSYRQFGRIAVERRDLDAAERWYEKSREIEERVGHGPAAEISRGILQRLRDIRAAGEQEEQGEH